MCGCRFKTWTQALTFYREPARAASPCRGPLRAPPFQLSRDRAEPVPHPERPEAEVDFLVASIDQAASDVVAAGGRSSTAVRHPRRSGHSRRRPLRHRADPPRRARAAPVGADSRPRECGGCRRGRIQVLLQAFKVSDHRLDADAFRAAAASAPRQRRRAAGPPRRGPAARQRRRRLVRGTIGSSAVRPLPTTAAADVRRRHRGDLRASSPRTSRGRSPRRRLTVDARACVSVHVLLGDKGVRRDLDRRPHLVEDRHPAGVHRDQRRPVGDEPGVDRLELRVQATVGPHLRPDVREELRRPVLDVAADGPGDLLVEPSSAGRVATTASSSAASRVCSAPSRRSRPRAGSRAPRSRRRTRAAARPPVHRRRSSSTRRGSSRPRRRRARSGWTRRRGTARRTRPHRGSPSASRRAAPGPRRTGGRRPRARRPRPTGAPVPAAPTRSATRRPRRAGPAHRSSTTSSRGQEGDDTDGQHGPAPTTAGRRTEPAPPG